MLCLRRLLPAIDFSSGADTVETLRSLEVRMADFEAALCEVEPSAIREVFVELPDVGLGRRRRPGQVKQRLIESVGGRSSHAEVFARAGTGRPRDSSAARPGCGKTLLAKAVASQTQVNFISVKGPSLLSKYVGESERGVREVFRKAKQAAPCIVFFDEIDALVPTRGGGGDSHATKRVIGQFLAEVNGVEELNGVLILGATNRPDILDPAPVAARPLRPALEIPLPDLAGGREIFRIGLRGQADPGRTRVEEFGRADRRVRSRRDPGGLHPRGLGGDPRGPRRVGVEGGTPEVRITVEHLHRCAGRAEPSRVTAETMRRPGQRQTGRSCRERIRDAIMRIATYLYGFARAPDRVAADLRGIEGSAGPA